MVCEGADFTDANLEDANLHKAICIAADFTGTNLTGANRSEVSLCAQHSVFLKG